MTNHLFVYHMQLNKDDAHNNDNNNIVLPIGAHKKQHEK